MGVFVGMVWGCLAKGDKFELGFFFEILANSKFILGLMRTTYELTVYKIHVLGALKKRLTEAFLFLHPKHTFDRKRRQQQHIILEAIYTYIHFNVYLPKNN